MMVRIHPHGLRLLLAIVVAAFLSVVFNLIESGRFPVGVEFVTLGIGFAFLLVGYGVVVTTLYLASLAAANLGLAAWAVFAVLFVCLEAGWFYHALVGYDFLEIGGIAMVTQHKIIPPGLVYWERSAAESALMAAATAFILFTS